MKTLHRVRYIKEISYKTKIGVETIKHIGYYSNMRYCEFQDGFKVDKEWSKLLNLLGYCDSIFIGHFSLLKGLYINFVYSDKYNNDKEKRIYKDNFIEIKSYFEENVVKQKDCHMSDLIKELNTEEFLEYMEDNQIGIEAIIQ